MSYVPPPRNSQPTMSLSHRAGGLLDFRRLPNKTVGTPFEQDSCPPLKRSQSAPLSNKTVSIQLKQDSQHPIQIRQSAPHSNKTVSTVSLRHFFVLWCGQPTRKALCERMVHRVTSLIRNTPLLGPDFYQVQKVRGGGTQNKKMSKGHLPRVVYDQVYNVY